MRLRTNLRVMRKMKKMELKLNIEFDEDKLRQLVEDAVEKLKTEGYIWRDKPEPFDWKEFKNRDKN